MADGERAVFAKVTCDLLGAPSLPEEAMDEPKVAIMDDRVIASSETELRVDLSPDTWSQYERLLKDAGVSYMAKSHSFEGHAFIEAGSGQRFGRDFGGLLLYGPGPGTPLCREQYRVSESGMCHFELSKKWHLHFGWGEPHT